MRPDPTNWREASAKLTELLSLEVAPMAITFSETAPADVAPFDGPMPAPGPDGRTGRVAAGCVFWMHGHERSFTTAAEDHANCSVGSLTHGLKTLDEVAGNADVAAILESGWATMEMVPDIPTVSKRPGAVTYGPLADATSAPDVVFLRLNAKQLMILHDAVPEMRLEGKPQCHIIPLALESGAVAASVGCMLSRVRTGMSNGQMTCALPASRLGELLARLAATAAADRQVAAYAAEDARRFRQIRP